MNSHTNFAPHELITKFGAEGEKVRYSRHLRR
jgi:hypothetical protein